MKRKFTVNLLKYDLYTEKCVHGNITETVSNCSWKSAWAHNYGLQESILFPKVIYFSLKVSDERVPAKCEEDGNGNQ